MHNPSKYEWNAGRDPRDMFHSVVFVDSAYNVFAGNAC